MQRPDTPVATAPDESYLAPLDGLRALAILIVVVAHFGLGGIVPGGFGVTAFFFLSGFLISRQLLAETARHDRIHVRNFYLRRLLRLGPALLLMIAVCVAIMPLIGVTLTAGEVLASALYVINYYDVFVGLPAAADMHHPFGILWSLAVEQHFYLLLPAVLALFWRRAGALLLACAVLAAAMLLWRYRLYDLCLGGPEAPALCGRAPQWRIYRSTDTRLDSILYGVMLTLALAGARGGRVLAWLTAWPVVALAAAALLASFVVRDPQFRETARYTLQGLALMPLFAAVVFAPAWAPARRALTTAPMRLVGQWSYSLYLFHWPAQIVAEHLIGPQVTPAWLILAVTLTMLLSLASYYGVEVPVAGLRRRLRAAARQA